MVSPQIKYFSSKLFYISHKYCFSSKAPLLLKISVHMSEKFRENVTFLAVIYDSVMVFPQKILLTNYHLLLY